MAFCTNCGRKLNPGEICVCQQQNAQTLNQAGIRQQIPNGQTANQAGMGQQVPNGQTANQAGMGQQMPNGQMHYSQGMPNPQMYYQQPKPKMNFDIQATAKNYLQLLIKPKSAGRAFAKEANMLVAFIYIAIQAICSGLFAMVLFGKINGAAKSQLIAWGAEAEELARFDMYKFPLVKDFFITVIASVALSCIVALVIWGMTSAFKGQTTFMEVISAVAVRCVGKTPVIVVAVLLGLINIGFGIIFFLLSAIVGICYSCMTVPTGSGANGDKTVFIVLVACVVSMLCFVFFFRYVSVNYFSSTLQTQVSKVITELQNSKEELSKLLTQFF